MRNLDRDYPSASRDAFEALAAFAIDRRTRPNPDARYLLRGLEGPIWQASLRSDGNITFRVRDQRERERRRSQRVIDADAFLALRWLLLPKAHLLVSRTDVEPDRARQLHYVTFGDHIKLTRIIADAPHGASVKFLDGGHLDLRRRNLAVTAVTPGPDQNSPRKGRPLAIATALANFSERDMGHLPIDRAAFEFLLRESFAFVDQLPLGTLAQE